MAGTDHHPMVATITTLTATMIATMIVIATGTATAMITTDIRAAAAIMPTTPATTIMAITGIRAIPETLAVIQGITAIVAHPAIVTAAAIMTPTAMVETPVGHAMTHWPVVAMMEIAEMALPVVVEVRQGRPAITIAQMSRS